MIYGNWGCIGWSAGKCNIRKNIDWRVGYIDDMDLLFKAHDKTMNHEALLEGLKDLGKMKTWKKRPPNKIYAWAYKRAAIIVFSILVKIKK